MLADGLIDELHLLRLPGGGRYRPAPVSPRAPRQTALTLAGSEAFDNGVVHLTYTPATG